MKPITKTFLWLTAFSIAMGFLETSVVVFLRKLYYPEGFDFPLIPVSYDIAVTEFWREAATIVMLIGAGVMAGRNKLQRFAFFIYSFAIWDIFYYVFLKVLLDWPSSLFTWDILFLIPVPWVGPVIAPCLISLSMILLASMIIYFQKRSVQVQICLSDWLLLTGGSIVVIFSFMWDYIIYLCNSPASEAVWTLSEKTEMFHEVRNYIPQHFNWALFSCGQAIILLAIFLIYKRSSNKSIYEK
ncbi:MAG: hypothetical protein M3R27_00390 [Bacteroidota bacterium]|nr:hypothetical protein [Bacteroidota bacterium]